MRLCNSAVSIRLSSSHNTRIASTTSANAANVKTELRLQPLKSRTRTPGTKGYRTKAFVAFTAGPGLISNVTVPAGFYAPAYRFVNIVTGQDTNLLTLPVVQVS